jgi:nicotinamidase-related amidase
MPVQTLDPRTALVLIDLQRGITALPTVHPVDVVLANAAKLARAFRERSLPVIRVRVAFSPDFGDTLHLRVDAPMSVKAWPADHGDLCEEIGSGPTDLHVTKRQWNAFYGTDLDLQLRRRNMTGLVLAGIATSLGVESTARYARELNYDLAIAHDACTDVSLEMHESSVKRLFPRIAHVDTTDAIVAALAAVPRT